MMARCVLALALLLAAPSVDPKPNLVLILADDFGYECVGANGGSSYRTPNLDRLAAGGLRFTRCFVQPLCTPTRVQLMTGLYNVRNYASFGEMDPKAHTFAHVLKKAGYATGIAGKWQLGRDPALPRTFGFDESCLWQHTRRPPRYANPGLEYDGVAKDFTNGEYGPDLVSDFALDFVRRKKDGPFFLYYPMMLTHDPFQPTPDSADWDPKAKGEKVNQSPNHFADMVAYMDKLVGKLVARLDELGLRERTLVLFVGDNGTLGQITSQLDGRPYRGGKGQPNAAGMRVPLIANWQKTIPAGKVCDDLVDSTDFLPTLAAAAGAAVPEGLDGRSFLPQLKGGKGEPREWIYCWYARDGGAEAQHESAFDARYKLTRAGKLFDLEADPGEKTPLPSDAAPEARRRLQAALDRYADARPASLRKTK
jgi:arylsulfatase A